MYKVPAVMDVKADFLNILEKNCVEITVQDCASRSLWSRMVSAVLRMFSPLL